jgi:hypothetical protein
MDDTKNGTELVLRDAQGRYLTGTCRWPRRPLNSRPELITALREALDEDDTLDRLRRVAIERMEAGDPAFWKMLLDRVWPAKVELSAESEHVVEFRWAEPEPTAHSQLLISRNGDQ